jgi:hypothetical protein
MRASQKTDITQGGDTYNWSVKMKVYHLVSAAIIAAAVTVAVAPVRAESTADEVKNWSVRQWTKARIEFAKDKTKWADCRKQGKAMKLKGKDSWSFLYGCMKA